jgi:hypothetical protein
MTFHREILSVLALPLVMASALTFTACSDDPANGGAGGSAGTDVGQAGDGSDGGGKGGTNADQAGGADGGGSGGEGGGKGGTDGSSDPVTQWLAGHWTTTPEGDWNGSVLLLDDLSAGGSVDLSQAEDFGTDITYAWDTTNRALFVGRSEHSSIQRFDVSADGRFELTGEIGFDAYGVTDTMGRSQPVIQFIEEDLAYYLDFNTLQVIPFNPSSTPMTIYPDEVFSFDGLLEGADDYVGDAAVVKRIGDRIFVTARFWNREGVAPPLVYDAASPLVKVAIIDIETGRVDYATDDRCAQGAWVTTDPHGNLYVGSHAALATSNAAGLNDAASPPPCIVRIKSGESEFDADYFVDLGELAEGALVGTLLQGADGHAYVLQYEGESDVTDGELGRAIMGEAAWRLHAFELENAAATYAPVEGVPLASAYSGAFQTTVGSETATFLILPGDGNVEAYYWDASNPLEPVRGLGFPGSPGEAIPFN